MSLTETEIDQLTDRITEEVLLKLPEAIGNLMSSLAWMSSINNKFYSAHPEFNDHREIVMKVMEEIDAAKPGKTYEQIVEASVPIIRDRIKYKTSLKSNPVHSIDRNKRHGDI